MTPTEQRAHDGLNVLPPAAYGPGAQLRAAREAAGLSIDQVAQQLKLAPRQVKALEDENFGELPGRTFSRGFIRNYARLLNLDAQDLVMHLPDSTQAPALEAPTLHSTGSLMAELPNAYASKTSLGRWLIPLVLVGCIVAAAGYEWYRGGLTPLTEPVRPAADTPERKPAVAAPTTQPPTMPPGQGTPLPNPLGNGANPAPPPAPAPKSGAAEHIGALVQTSPPTDPSATVGTSKTGKAAVVIAYRGASWTKIRDAKGQLLLARLVPADSVQPVDGTAPFDLLLGNARAVKLTYRGQPVDLTPYTRRNIARLTLK